MNGIIERFKHDIHSITMLRGLACLAVCFMHFTGTVDSAILNSIGRYGGYGVPVFFAISGFIIPYSLNKSNYKLSNFFTFLTKRMIRLEPPFIASIIGIFLLSAIAQLSPFNTSQQIPLFTSNTFYHLFYMVDFAGGYWLNPVYWTLAIEFQFYLICGLIFSIINSKNKNVLISLFITLSLCSFLFTDDTLVTHYFVMFLPGIVLYWFITLKISRNIFGLLCSVIALLGANIYGISAPISAFIAISFILFIKKPLKPLIFIGEISYSLYLIHTIVGTDGLINFMQNYITDENDRIWLMFLSFPFVIGMAWIFYILIERPSKRISKKIKYRLNKEE